MFTVEEYKEKRSHFVEFLVSEIGLTLEDASKILSSKEMNDYTKYAENTNFLGEAICTNCGKQYDGCYCDF